MVLHLFVSHILMQLAMHLLKHLKYFFHLLNLPKNIRNRYLLPLLYQLLLLQKQVEKEYPFYHNIAAFHIQIDSATGSHPDKGVGPQVGQLLHGNGGGGAADAGGDHAHLLPQQGAGPGLKLPIGAHMDRPLQPLGNGAASARITRQDTVAPHIPRTALDMKL